MGTLNLTIAIVPLVIAVLAFQRAGGIKVLRKNTAELLAKMEKRVREEAANAYPSGSVTDVREANHLPYLEKKHIGGSHTN